MIKKIGVFGDSFADPIKGEDERNEESWMSTLEQLRGVECKSFGISGISLWGSYTYFLENYQDYDAVVFVFTEHHRIHNLNQKRFKGKNFIRPETVSQLNFLEFREKLLLKSITQIYFKEFQSDLLDDFIYQQVFDSVNSLSSKAGKKIVNVFPFECNSGHQQMIDTRASHGDCYYGLLDISVSESQASSRPLDPYSFDPRDCHLTKENNENLAKLISKSLDSETRTNYYINIEPEKYGFVFSEEISDRYFNR